MLELLAPTTSVSLVEGIEIDAIPPRAPNVYVPVPLKPSTPFKSLNVLSPNDDVSTVSPPLGDDEFRVVVPVIETVPLNVKTPDPI